MLALDSCDPKRQASQQLPAQASSTPGKFPFPEASFSDQFQFYFRSVSLSAFLAYIKKKKKTHINALKFLELFFPPVDEIFFKKVSSIQNAFNYCLWLFQGLWLCPLILQNSEPKQILMKISPDKNSYSQFSLRTLGQVGI